MSGFVLPYPIFFDVQGWELVVNNLYEDGYLDSAGWPVPVGLFSSLLLLGVGATYGSVQSLPSKTWFYLGTALLSMMGFSLYASFDLSIPRVVSLVVPIFSCILLGFFLAVPTLLLPSLRGYLWGLSALLILHSSSAVYEMSTNFLNTTWAFQSIFGFFIYQSLISYSAILSFLVCASLYHMSISRKKKTFYLMLSLGLLSIFLVILGQRKAFLMDLGLMAACLSFYLVRNTFVRRSLSITSIFSVFTLIALAILTLIYSFADRSQNLLGNAIEQRGFAYRELADTLASGNSYQFLFGYLEGWGGYSNFFIELILRLGLFGLLLYFAAIFFSLKFVVNVFRKTGMETSQGFFRTQRDPFWLFLILSVAAANAINMNLQLPYYTQNIIFLSLMFFYFDKIVPNSASIRRKKASALLKIENPIVERT
jgi:hypothetical protein